MLPECRVQVRHHHISGSQDVHTACGTHQSQARSAAAGISAQIQLL